MASTVNHKAGFGTGFTRTESVVSLAEDGLVTARIVYAALPSVSPSPFLLDSPPPGGLPAAAQGYALAANGLFLTGFERQVANGLQFITATYAGCMGIPRIAQSQSVETRSYVGPLITQTIGGQSSLSFDYKIATTTFRYAILSDSIFRAEPQAQEISRFNIKSVGRPPEPRLEQIISEQIETVGRVRRVAITATGVFVDDPVDRRSALWAPVDPYGQNAFVGIRPFTT
jgi:hypothetical protein